MNFMKATDMRESNPWRLSPSWSANWPPRLTIIMAASISLLAAMTMFASHALQQVYANTEWLVHTERVRIEIGRVLQLLTDVETAERGFALARDEQFLQPYQAAVPQVPRELAALGELVADNPIQRAAVARLQTLAEARIAHAQRVIELATGKDVDAARTLIAKGEGKRVMDQVRDVVNEMLAEQSRLVDMRSETSAHALGDLRRAQWATGGLAVVLLLLIASLTMRHNTRLRRSEKTLATTLRSIGDGVIATDAAGDVQFLNAVAEQLTGWTQSDALGQPLARVFRIVNEHTREEVESAGARMLREGQVLDLATHTLLIGRGGREYPIAESAAPIQDAQELVGVVVVFQDATARRAAEQALQEREQRFVTLTNAMPQIVWTESPQRFHEYFNRGWYAYTGLTEEESNRADAWTRVLHPEDEVRVAAHWMRSRATGELYETECRLRRYDGAYRWFLIRAVADRDTEGNILRWFGTCTDIHSTKQTEEALRRTEAALRESDHRKDVFLATLSHELRNPLAPIRNAARLLEKSSLSPTELERIRSIIGRQVRHMASLLDDLLDISRITRGAFKLKKKYVALQTLLAEAIETARPLIEAKRHALTTEWPPDPIQIEADPVRLVQVVSNLITNAAKYTDPGGAITCAARVDGTMIVISVRDSGIGLARDMLDEVFQMFSQVHPQGDRSEGGLGIGLALVKGLVELHGGHIEAHSAGLGQGSEFLVFLPDLRVATGTIEGSMVASTNPSLAPSLERRILVADDNRDGAESLALILQNAGFSVFLAHTGNDALALAAQHRPHAVILDIGMPDVSGYDVAQQIRREAWGSELILIAVTGWGQDEDKRRAQSAGFDHHFTKPVDLEALEPLLVPKNPT